MEAAASVAGLIALRRSRPKVAIIDDDAIVRALVKLHLVNGGYDVLEAEDAITGGYLAIGSSPDLIICDVEMPHMSGYDLVAALKSDPATQHIPVIFLTVVDNVAEHAKRLGAVAYLNKPVMADRLMDVIAAAVGVPRKER